MCDVTSAEACAVLDIDQSEADYLLAGPFAPSNGLLHVRQLFGCSVALSLPMLESSDAAKIALAVFQDARTDAPPRLLAVGWKDAEPIGCWLSEGLATDIKNTLLILPADRMLADLTARLAAHRASALRPN